MGRSIQAVLAKWRREHGEWRIIVIGEGYDDEITVVLSGAHSQTFAETYARFLAAKSHGDSWRRFHVKEARRVG